MPTVTGWQCDTCLTVYRTLDQANACQSQTMKPPSVKPGSIVLTHAGFGWFDGDKAWIENYDRLLASPHVKLLPRGEPNGPDGPMLDRGVCPNGDNNCFGECCTFQFYYVVATVDHEPANPSFGIWVNPKGYRTHRWRYHIFTKAMLTGYSEGYTFEENHIPPRIVLTPPKKVWKEGQKFLGKKTEHLL